MFRELDINWNGEQKLLKPTMDLLRYLEQRDVGPHFIANLIAEKKVRPVTLATFVAAVMQYAGFKVSDEDLYVEASQPDGFQKLYATAVNFVYAMLPQTAVKADTAPAKKPKAPRRTTAR